jgi:hypothetical protein
MSPPPVTRFPRGQRQGEVVVGVGTIFTVRLPVAPGPGEDAASPP